MTSALKIYDTIRRPFGNGIVERSRSTGFLYEFNELPDGLNDAKMMEGDQEELQKLGMAMQEKWSIQWSALPDVEWRAAQDMLLKLGEEAEFIRSNL